MPAAKGNKYASANLKFKTPKELQSRIDEYFKGGYRTRKVVDKEGHTVEVPCITITDLVLYLGFCDRQSFYDYEKKIKFACTIKRARTFIEREYESYLLHNNCTGAIFALKNFGWKDRQEIDTGENLTNILSALRKSTP